MAEKRIKHDYTNEVELKSLAIREKNKKLNIGIDDEKLNIEIEEKIREYIKTKNPDLKNEIIKLSESVKISKESHEYFGKIIILMIKKILTKPNFAGYSWYDDFYSDSCFRVFKYIHNFDHTLKSSVTGSEVSCFSYITQIIHNSILAIINEKNKQSKEMESLVKSHNIEYGIISESENKSIYDDQDDRKYTKKIDEFTFENIEMALKEAKDLNFKNCEIIYNNHTISMDDYASICEIFKKYKTINCNLVKGVK